ncbi:hypothetical protein D6856_04160 [Butyrivibrio sp. XB500-5]|uniref:YcaO-like family protein n=1 Tax=Butyrivibrio sp. XB500-5 TaxID=2364880 RepID=UPI000EA83CA7|nr:YcaO-like family protein [Butyrivibrio sp. XB500-5]RKM63322.1 hypothetical protein D6856_04160 [Butyrivibrio sp. XB500-5]
MLSNSAVLLRNPALSTTPFKDGVLISADGELKMIECDHDVLEEVLGKADHPITYKELLNAFVPKYEKEEVEAFIDVLLEEKLIKKIEKKTRKKIHLRVIGEGKLAEYITDRTYDDIEITEVVGACEYLKRKGTSDDSVVLIVSENYDIGTVLDLNEKMLADDTAFTVISTQIDSIKLGPSVVPYKSACVGCYYTHQIEQLRIVSGENIGFEDIRDIKHSFPCEEVPEETSVYVSKVMNEIRTLYREDDLPAFMNKIIEFDSSNEKRVIAFTPTTSCPYCKGMNRKLITYEEYKNSKSEEPQFISNEKILYKVGGYRSTGTEETKKILDEAIERTGLEVRVEEAGDNPLADVMPSFDASVKTSYKNKTPYIMYAINSQGKGLNPRQAYFSACFELFERLSARYYGDKRLVRATPNEVGKDGYSLELIKRQKRMIDKEYDIDHDRAIDWVEAKSVLSGKSKLVPASFVYLSNVTFKSIDNGISSTGLAAGATVEDAVLQGLFEVIEHDAWIMGQANRCVLPRVDIYSSKNNELKKLMKQIEELGYEIITRDYSNDLGFPVFRTWIVDRNDYEHYAVNGFGASLSAEIALERSVTEAVQSLIPEKDIDICDYGSVSDYESMYSYDSFYSLSYFVRKDINSEGEIKKMDEYKDTEYLSVKEMIDIVSGRIKEVLGEDADILYTNLTKKSIGIPVVRVIVEGDVQRTGDPVRAVSARTLKYPVYKKVSNKEAVIEDLYLGPYPH